MKAATAMTPYRTKNAAGEASFRAIAHSATTRVATQSG